jgi:hypothetical protein
MLRIITKNILIICTLAVAFALRADELDEIFANPPESAKPGVLWMWMGCNLSSTESPATLSAENAGFNRTTMFSLADVHAMGVRDSQQSHSRNRCMD